MQEGDWSGPTERTRVRRLPGRGQYDRGTIYRILDDALIGHVGFIADGLPHVIPMVIARRGDELLIHGSAASRLTRRLTVGVDVCVSVTHLDGVVVSRSAFDSSMNYRSVVIFGRARPVTDLEDKVEALRTVVEHVLPGRWQEARPPADKELRAIKVLSLPLTEASAKVRSGPPQDDEADLESGLWAGEIPLRMISLRPVADRLLGDGIPLPASVERFQAERIRGVDDLPAP